MTATVLAMSQLHEEKILYGIGKTASLTALDDLLKAVFGAMALGGAPDEFVEKVCEAVRLRKEEIAAAQLAAARKPAKWGSSKPCVKRLTVEERREQAERRATNAGWFSSKLEKAGVSCSEIYAILPRASVRSVLHTICELCALSRGRCDASIATIAKQAGCSRSAVEQALAALKAANFIAIESGKRSGMTSIIRPARASLLKVIEWCRQRLARLTKKADAASPSTSTGGGTQKNEQKTESHILNKIRTSRSQEGAIMKTDRVVSFPSAGSIYFTPWRALVKKHSTGTTPDADVVADVFRKFCRDRKIPLNAPKIEDRFIKIVKKFRV